jgi:hypothetical protein
MLPEVCMFALLLFFACADKSEDTADDRPAGGCPDEPYWEKKAEPTADWTPADGCFVLCEEVDDGGLIYRDCYITDEEEVFCQYDPPCD